jgi:regulator of RNase E activity RraA
VFPNDVVVADADGAVLIPAALLDEVVKLAVRKERFDEWAVREVKNGAPLPGLYPPNAETKARYEAEIAQRKGL